MEQPSLATTPQTKHGGNADKPFLLPELGAVWFGWAEFQPTTQRFELWFDEIAIDGERIGCTLWLLFAENLRGNGVKLRATAGTARPVDERTLGH